ARTQGVALGSPRRPFGAQTGCHGLAPWSLTLAVYSRPFGAQTGCHGLAPWSLTLAVYSRPFGAQTGCHGLAPWSLTLAVYRPFGALTPRPSFRGSSSGGSAPSSSSVPSAPCTARRGPPCSGCRSRSPAGRTSL